MDAGNWKAFLDAPGAVLVLGKSDCEACRQWAAELEAFLAEDERFGEVRFGKLLLDQRGLVEFKRANPWIATVDSLPFNVLYVDGKRVKSWAGGGVGRLVNRLQNALGTPAGPPDA